MKAATKQWLWLLLYFFVLLAPLIVLLIGPRPAPREFWRELSVALGFSGLALMGVQFIPTARLRPLTNVFPMDDVYYFHLRAALIAFALVLAHPLILFLFNPTAVRLLNPLTAPPRITLGLVSLLALAALIVTSIFRKPLKISYELWRLVHVILTPVTIIVAMLHMLGVDYYLSLPWQRGVWIGLTVVWMGIIAHNRLTKPLRLLRRPYRLVDSKPETGRAWTLVLRPDGHEGFRFMPGQFAWLTIQRSPFGMRSHPFSIASSAASSNQLQFTIAELGDFTSRIGEVPVGEVVYVDGPHGSFSIDRYDGPGYVFIAGGIGSPPMLSMLRTMRDRRSHKPAWFFYGNPEWESVTFREELETLKQELDLQVIHALERPPAQWDGETGFIDADMLRRHLPDNRNELVYFICGPQPMIAAVLAALRQIGVPPNNVHTEQYDMV
jgi:predicted ferric reductase